MRDSTERDLAVADALGEMADARIKELEAEVRGLRDTLRALQVCTNNKCSDCAALLRAALQQQPRETKS